MLTKLRNTIYLQDKILKNKATNQIYYHPRQKKNEQPTHTITAIKTKENGLIKDPFKINKSFYNFYTDLYTVVQRVIYQLFTTSTKILY